MRNSYVNKIHNVPGEEKGGKKGGGESRVRFVILSKNSQGRSH